MSETGWRAEWVGVEPGVEEIGEAVLSGSLGDGYRLARALAVSVEYDQDAYYATPARSFHTVVGRGETPGQAIEDLCRDLVDLGRDYEMAEQLVVRDVAGAGPQLADGDLLDEIARLLRERSRA